MSKIDSTPDNELKINDAIFHDAIKNPNLKTKMEKLPMAQNIEGIEGTVKFMEGLVKITNVIHSITAPESAGGAAVTLTEYPQFLPVALAVPGMISAIPSIPKELSDQITPEELGKIKAVLQNSEYLNTNADLVAAINDGLAIANSIKEFVNNHFGKQNV